MKLKMWVIFTSFVDDTGIVKEIAYMCNKEGAARTMCKKMNDKQSSVIYYTRYLNVEVEE